MYEKARLLSNIQLPLVILYSLDYLLLTLLNLYSREGFYKFSLLPSPFELSINMFKLNLILAMKFNTIFVFF